VINHLVTSLSSLNSPIRAIYTDGSGDRDLCGYAAVVCFADGGSIDLGGCEANSTNHRAELLGLIVALEYVSVHPQSMDIPIFSDSQYAVDGWNDRWVATWQQNNWTSSKGKPVLNRDLWELLEAFRFVPATFYHLRGHTDAFGKKGKDALAKNRERFGADSELHDRGNLAADRAAERFRLGLATPTHQLDRSSISSINFFVTIDPLPD
jgi:ribonuclease HI